MNNTKRRVIMTIFVIGICVLTIAPTLAGEPMGNGGHIYYADGAPVNTNTTTNSDFTMNITNLNKSLGYWVPPQFGTNDTAYSTNGLTTGWDVNKNYYCWDTQTPEGVVAGNVLEFVVCDGSLCNTTYYTVTNQDCISGSICVSGYFDIYLPPQSGIANHVEISEVQVGGAIDISAEEAHQMLEENVAQIVLLDVRTEEEYTAEHIADAKHIPSSELDGRIGELDADKKIIVYGKSGGSSRTASGKLVQEGFTDVYNMLGGINAWRLLYLETLVRPAGTPTVAPSPSISPSPVGPSSSTDSPIVSPSLASTAVTPAPEGNGKTPGFEVVFAMAAFVIVVFALKRKEVIKND